jgi:hypothetical protein
MISSLGGQWSTADLTGNGLFVDTGTDIYVVTNLLADGSFKVLRSADEGRTFTTAATHTLSSGTVQFDPAISYYGGNLHIVGSQANPAGGYDLILLTFTVGTQTLSAPVTVVAGTKIHSGYDIQPTPSGAHVLVTAVFDSTSPLESGYALICVAISALGSVTGTTTIDNQGSSRSGEVFGGISLIPSGTDMELYYTAHSRKLTFGSIEQEIRTRTLDTTVPYVWSAASVVTNGDGKPLTYTSHYIDDKLTVVGFGTTRVLTSLYYTQTKGKLYTTMILASRISGVWKFAEYAGTTNYTYQEPTLSVDSNNAVTLAYLVGDLNSGVGGSLNVSTLDVATLNYTSIRGSFNQLQFRWLRGSKFAVRPTSSWEVVGERPVYTSSVITGYEPVYVSALNVAPVVVLNQTTATLQREILLHLDASASYDSDLDPITFEWACDDWQVELRPIPGSPALMDVWVPKSVGPLTRTFHVTVTLQDFDVLSAPINAPAIGTVTVTVPANAAPVISWTPSSTFNLPRNSAVVLVPTITDAEVDGLTYQWTQLTGPTLELLDLTTLPYLYVKTHGVNILGDVVTFGLSVSDGINLPVTSTVTLNIASINLTNLDSQFISRAVFSNSTITSPITARNNPNGASAWSSVMVGAVSSDFFKVRSSRNVLTGHRRQIYISPRSVAVIGEEVPDIFYRKIFLPGNDRGTIVDAFQTELDETLVLTEAYRLLRYTPEHLGVDNLSDYWQDVAEISPYLRDGVVKHFSAATAVGGHRVYAFVTDKGLLLMQIRESDFLPEAVVFLSVFDLNLYGGDDVLFVRFHGVESIRKGQVLIGTSVQKTPGLAGSGLEYFETIYDLDIRAVTNVWDRTNRINETVITGELLDLTGNDYSGLLQAPILHLTPLTPTTFRLWWEQVRSDLVLSYQIYASITPGIPGTSYIPAAPITTYPPPVIIRQPSDQTVAPGNDATFTVIAAGLEPLSYQWRRDGVPVGTNSPTLFLPAVTVGDSGHHFSVVVSDTYGGSVTSVSALLTVAAFGPPTTVTITSPL